MSEVMNVGVMNVGQSEVSIRDRCSEDGGDQAFVHDLKLNSQLIWLARI